MEATFSNRQKKDLRVLAWFVRIYCEAKHDNLARDKRQSLLPEEAAGMIKRDHSLCSECATLMAYAMEKRRKCPLDPKPSCKNCPIHCYSKEYRAKMREVMSFSGKRLILRGRLDLLWHYLF